MKQSLVALCGAFLASAHHGTMALSFDTTTASTRVLSHHEQRRHVAAVGRDQRLESHRAGEGTRGR
jgi:hypothetical protein